MKHHLIKLLAIVLVCVTFSAISAPKMKSWSLWTAHDASSTKTIDYAGWGEFLQRYVFTNPQGVNLVAYSAVTAQDKQKLKQILTAFSAIPISQYNRDEQRAFWINLYNALTIDIVLDHYPVQSIRDIDLSPGLFEADPWGGKVIKVEDTPVSLNDIEHRILRPIWNDPRLHYALNCASISCPNLMKVAYTPKNMEQLMDQNAIDYVNSMRGVWFGTKNRMYVSSIYMWYRDDFGGSDPGVIAHLRKYAKPPLLRELEGRRSISGHDYDWSLNDGRK
jgi:hypothetical protein